MSKSDPPRKVKPKIGVNVVADAIVALGVLDAAVGEEGGWQPVKNLQDAADAISGEEWNPGTWAPGGPVQNVQLAAQGLVDNATTWESGSLIVGGIVLHHITKRKAGPVIWRTKKHTFRLWGGKS